MPARRSGSLAGPPHSRPFSQGSRRHSIWHTDCQLSPTKELPVFCHSKHSYGSHRYGSDDWRRHRRDRAAEYDANRRVRRRAAAEFGFYTHFFWYLGVIALLAVLNLMTFSLWFLWPAFGWGIGLFSHYMAVFGRRLLRERYFEPGRRARGAAREGARCRPRSRRASTSSRRPSRTRSAIRSPPPRAWCSRWARTRSSVENVEYAKVALDELDRVERRISHLLKYAKEEDYSFAQVNLADRGRLGADPDARQARRRARCSVARNYIGGPTVARRRREAPPGVRQHPRQRDRRARPPVAEGRRIDLFIENGGRPRHACACATTAAASRPRRSTASSTRSSPPRRRAPASAWRSRRRSSRRTRARSTSSSEAGARHRVRDHAAAAGTYGPTRWSGASWSSTTRRRCVLALSGLLVEGGLPGRDRRQRRGGAARASRPGSFHVVVTDLSMGGVSGMQVLEHARARRSRRRR